jgi:hypothetical protein
MPPLGIPAHVLPAVVVPASVVSSYGGGEVNAVEAGFIVLAGA